jgi:hypothetical protein
VFLVWAVMNNCSGIPHGYHSLKIFWKAE